MELKKKTIVALSSIEYEYRAIAHATTESLWLQSLMREIGIILARQPILWCDNIGATYLTANPIFHTCAKDIEIDYHFIQEKVQQKSLKMRFISRKDQLAYGLTKTLVSSCFALFRTKLNVIPSPMSFQGRIKEIIQTIDDKQNPRSIITP